MGKFYFALIFFLSLCSFRTVEAKAGSLLSPNGATGSKKEGRKLGSLVAAAPSKTSAKPAPLSTKKDAQSTSVTKSSWRGPACVLGGALAHLTFGSMYCWGNFLSYSPMNLRFFDGKDHPGSQPDSAFSIPLTLLSQCITMPFGPLVVKKLGARNTLLLGSWMVAAGVFFSSYATNLAQFLSLYAVLFGCGAGLGYTAPMVAGWSWMPELKGLVSGAVLTGYGAGGFFFNLIGTKLVNPNGVDPIKGVFPAEIYNNFPKMLRTLAGIYFVLSSLGSLLVSEPASAPVPTQPANKNAKKGKEVAPVGPAGLDVGEALGTYQFWLLWAMIFSSASAGLNVASMYKQFASGAPELKGDAFQSLVGGMGALFNGGGRLFWGSLSDKLGFKNSFTVLTIAQAVVQLLYPFSAKSKTTFLASTCLCFFLLAGNFAMMPPATTKIFGQKNGALIYGIVYTAFATASIATMFLSKILLAKLGWTGVFQLLASVSLLATVLTTFLKPVKKLPSSVV